MKILLRFLFGLWVLLGSCPARSVAAFLTAVEVTQPFMTEGGVVVSTVTYLKYLGSEVPGYAVGLVGSESWVTDELGKPTSANLAACARIRTGHGGLRGDTLMVWIDLSAARDTAITCGASLDAIVAATVECVLVTAWRGRFGWDPQRGSRVEADWVRLDILGAPRHSALGGVFAVKTLGPLPRRAHFDE